MSGYKLFDYHTDKQILENEFETVWEATKAKLAYLKSREGEIHNNLIIIAKYDSSKMEKDVQGAVQ